MEMDPQTQDEATEIERIKKLNMRKRELERKLKKAGRAFAADERVDMVVEQISDIHRGLCDHFTGKAHLYGSAAPLAPQDAQQSLATLQAPLQPFLERYQQLIKAHDAISGELARASATFFTQHRKPLL
jgi:hypothetical protein